MLDDRERFSQECIEEIRIQSEDAYFQNLTQMWMEESVTSILNLLNTEPYITGKSAYLKS